MTIITKKGNLLDAKGIIVHGCNCQGVMGSGVALAIKNKWPIVFDAYRRAHQSDGLRLGQIQWVRVEKDVVVINAMTQLFYGKEGKRYVSYDAVEEAFSQIRKLAWDLGLTVNFPLLGAGLGGGNWKIISNIISVTLGDEIEKVLWVQ